MANGIELAKAYVQIVPSADGIQGSISHIMGGEASAAGESAGTLLGTKLVGTLKGDRCCGHRQDDLGFSEPWRRIAAEHRRRGDPVQRER